MREIKGGIIFRKKVTVHVCLRVCARVRVCAHVCVHVCVSTLSRLAADRLFCTAGSRKVSPHLYTHSNKGQSGLKLTLFSLLLGAAFYEQKKPRKVWSLGPREGRTGGIPGIHCSWELWGNSWSVPAPYCQLSKALTPRGSLAGISSKLGCLGLDAKG